MSWPMRQQLYGADRISLLDILVPAAVVSVAGARGLSVTKMNFVWEG